MNSSGEVRSARMEACASEDVPDSWSLHPLVIQHVPTDEDKRKCPALVGVEDILYGNGPACVQTTYRTQGNNALELAKGAKTEEDRLEKLNLALRLYDAALDLDLTPDLEKEAITQKEISERTAALLSNKAEALRQLGELPEAYAAATLALTYDKECWKAYLRRARVCEEIDDVARAESNYKKAYDTSFRPDILRLLHKARDTYARKATEYAAIAAYCVQSNPRLRGKLGLALPFCKIKNTLTDVQANLCTLHVIYPELSMIERIESFSYTTPLQAYLDILFGAQRDDSEYSSIYKPHETSILYGLEWCDIIGESGKIERFSSMSATFVEADLKSTLNDLLDKGYTVPLVPTIFIVGKKAKDAFPRTQSGSTS